MAVVHNFVPQVAFSDYRILDRAIVPQIFECHDSVVSKTVQRKRALKSILVYLCNEPYVNGTIASAQSARENGNWHNGFVTIIDEDTSREKEQLLVRAEIIVKRLLPLSWVRPEPEHIQRLITTPETSAIS